MQPHRGAMIFTFGIVGVALGLTGCCCGLAFPVALVFGILAWAMGAQDLRAMNEGRMDPYGRGMTLAGMVLGIISVVLAVLAALLTVAAVVSGGPFRHLRPRFFRTP